MTRCIQWDTSETSVSNFQTRNLLATCRMKKHLGDLGKLITQDESGINDLKKGKTDAKLLREIEFIRLIKNLFVHNFLISLCI